MSHTNTTTNYNLPQFVPTAKPAWLTDINGAFSDIDTAVNTAQSDATTAGNNATQALSDASAAATAASAAATRFPFLLFYDQMRNNADDNHGKRNDQNNINGFHIFLLR